MPTSDDVRKWASYCAAETEIGRAAYGVINALADFAWMLETWREEDSDSRSGNDQGQDAEGAS